jgi:single-strand DNA-binding protein
MNHLNSILIEGSLVEDPKFGETLNGTPICTFSISSNRFFKNKYNDELEKEVCCFEVETWAKLAESCKNLGHKGRGVRVVGRLRQERMTGADGSLYPKVSIVAEHVEFRPEFAQERSKV